MDAKQIAEVLTAAVRETLVMALVNGLRHAVLVDDKVTFLPAETTPEQAQARASRDGGRLLNVNDTDDQCAIGESLMREALRGAESEIAEGVAKGASKA